MTSRSEVISAIEECIVHRCWPVNVRSQLVTYNLVIDRKNTQTIIVTYNNLVITINYMQKLLGVLIDDP